MGNLFSENRETGLSAPLADLLPNLMAAVPAMTSLLSSLKGNSSSGLLSSIDALRGMDPEALKDLVRPFAGAIPGLEELFSEKE